MTRPCRSLEYLHPVIRGNWSVCCDDIAKMGFDIFETWRDPKRQTELYAQGKTQIEDLGYHSFGLAMDVVRKDKAGWHWDYYDNPEAPKDQLKVKKIWVDMMECMEDAGFESGGISWGWDYPHFQETFGFNLNDLRKGNLPHHGYIDWQHLIKQKLGMV